MLAVTGRAAATYRGNDSVEIFFAIVVRDLVAWVDIPARPNPDAAAPDSGFGVGPAGMINVTGNVVAPAAVN